MREDVSGAEAAARRVRDVLAPLATMAVAPPVLQPAGLYLELVGEDVRRRAVLAQGESLCLRPDMTIPAARLALQLDLWGADPFLLLYDGRVFQRRADAGAPSEDRQIGLECYAPNAFAEESDATLVRAAIEAARAAGVEPRLVFGAHDLTAAIARASGFSPDWTDRLCRAGARGRSVVSALQAGAGRGERDAPASALAQALAAQPAERAAAIVQDLLAAANIAPVGGRSVEEVALRLRDRGLRSALHAPEPAAVSRLTEALAIEAAPGAGLKALRLWAKRAANAAELEGPLARLERLWARLATMQPDAVFKAELRRSFAYYDGLVFELHGPKGESLGGGGRYDRALPALAQAEGVPAKTGWGAAGFMLAPARLAEAAT